MIILFALLLLKYGYISVYFVDLKAHEESQRSWLGEACWGCLFSLIDRDDLNSTYSVYKLQLEQLCDFVPSDRLFSFLSHLCSSPNFWWKERKAGTGDSRWKPPISGSVGEPVAITLHRKHRLVRCWQWQRHETLALLSLGVKSRRGKAARRTPLQLSVAHGPDSRVTQTGPGGFSNALSTWGRIRSGIKYRSSGWQRTPS